MRKLLYIDSSYTYEQIKKRKLDNVLSERNLENFFDKVWSLNPIDTHPKTTFLEKPIGKHYSIELEKNHTFIRGRFGRYNFLKKLSILNFLISLLSLLFYLRKLIKKEKINIIRSADPNFCGILSLILIKMTSAKLICRVAGDYDYLRKKSGKPTVKIFLFPWFEEFIEKQVIQNSAKIIVPSKKYSEYAIKKGAKPENINLIRYSFFTNNAHLIEPSKRNILNRDLTKTLQNKKWLVHIGRLISIKRVDDCLEVLSILVKEKVDVNLCLIGDGPLKYKLKMKVKQLNLGKRVLFLGNVNQIELAALLPNFSLALSPLTGRALMEVAFAGISVVAYNVDWHSEIIITNKNGILVNNRDILGMAKASKEIINNPSIAKYYGKKLRETALKNFNKKDQIKKELELYNSII